MDTPEPSWMADLPKRLRPHVHFCRDYVVRHNHGTPGHINLVTIAALADLLDQRSARLDELERRIDSLTAVIGNAKAAL